MYICILYTFVVLIEVSFRRFSNDFVFQHLDTSTQRSQRSNNFNIDSIAYDFNWINVKSKNPITVYEHIYVYIIAHSRRMWRGLDLSSRSDSQSKSESQPIDCFADFSRRRQWITSGSWRPVLVWGLGSWVGDWVGGCTHSSDLTWLHDWHCMRWTTTNTTSKRVQGIIWESAARTFASTNCSNQSNKIPYKYI